MEEQSKKCGSCRFSRTITVIDPVTVSLFPSYREMLKPERKETKCHLQGPPLDVNPDRDWCYKWEPQTNE